MLTLNDGRTELWQWDTGRTLAVDADCSQVHFSNKVFGRSIDVDVSDGVAIIPDILLQTDKDLNVWAFVGTAEKGYTKISKTFKVNRRNKPADYVFTPTDQITLQTIQSQIGGLADLTTEAKDTLVAAINEVARTGGVDVSGAQVGQTIRVSAVDENGKPTEWEAADMPSGVQPDWNQNDDTQPDYVKNRPFYTGNPVETVLVEESTVSFAPAEGVYMGELQSTFVATVGETYKVSWDGTTYESTCVNFNRFQVIGNLSIVGAGSDTGEPFLIVVGNGERIRIGTTDNSDSHTISISEIAPEIVKIPAKYIDKDTSGYIVIHKNSTMTEQEAQNYKNAILKGEAVFIIWGGLCIESISFGSLNGVYFIRLKTLNGEEYSIAQNGDGLFSLNDRKFSGLNSPRNIAIGDACSKIYFYENTIKILPSKIYPGVGTTDALFQVEPNGTKSKAFEVLGNGETVTPALILYSSTADSTKRFRVTVDDNGTISATEVT